MVDFKSIAKLGLVLTVFLSSVLMMGQDNNDVTFEMKLSKPKLGLNERLRVDFIMNRDGDNFNPPDFTGFKVIMGPSQSISSSWINGVRSYSKSYSYTLSPTARGKFTIKQASIVIGGETYKSLAQNVEVTAAVDKPSDQMTADDIADENLHLVAEISKTNPYLNEAITVIYKLYVSPDIRVSNYQPLDNPTYNNFWSQDIKVNALSAQNGTYKGKPYRYVILKRVVLYPQKSGKLDIEPLSLDVSVDVPTQRRDFFGQRMYAQTNKTVSAGNRTINVKALPLDNQPADFNGAVGDFDFSVTTSKKSLNASESLQATIEVSGRGNLKLFKLPELELPSALEVYEPEFTEGVRTTLAGMQGKVSNQYTIVPSFRGKYPISPLSFSYFNPSTEKYKTLTSDEIVINVLEGPLSASSNSDATTNSNKQSVVSSGNEFNFLKLTPNLTSKSASYFFGSTSFYLWLLGPLLLIPLAIFFRKKRDAIAGDIVGNKIRKANKLARKYLSAARKQLGNKESFYVALERALHNYLKAKLKIETSEFSKDKITELLTEKQIDDTTVNSFIALLKNCEAARYSPFSNVQMQADYDKASEVISLMDKQL
ncbi:oxygen tolerance protein BatD [Maribacter caenipelagi]|uniref:Oxygen tolerance protein BatD n=2 Tax=Maribacter caenipelagi TaxID=1447781 RepID=A0A4R7D002_9FLAO|nr:oxygen tolerance protein BatD [Maribacter caenipelagi]